MADLKDYVSPHVFDGKRPLSQERIEQLRKAFIAAGAHVREVILDTESTGLEPDDRVIEIACVELIDHRPTGKTWHSYVNPEGRPVHPEAFAVHGLSDEFLADKPTFREIVDDLRAFVGDCRIVAHNANFDCGMLNTELRRIDYPPSRYETWTDTLALAVRKFGSGPGRNTLDALCDRFGIDRSRRTKHDALVDCQLLAEVYLELIEERQGALFTPTGHVGVVLHPAARKRPAPWKRTPVDLAAWQKLVRGLRNPIWSEYVHETVHEDASVVFNYLMEAHKSRLRT